jgi:ADP-ribose pyrophosphatase
MSASLTDHQRESLDAYEDFQKRYPKVFDGRKRRPIVLDRARLEAYATEHGVTLGIAAATPYAYFVVDLVESTGAEGGRVAHPYFRVIYRKQLNGAINVVILATIANPSIGRVGDIVLVEQERHATGTVEVELPRGFGEVGMSGAQDALRELEEETGFIGSQARLLGKTFTDSGLTDAEIQFFHVAAVARRPAQPEIGEAILGLRFKSTEEIWREISDGSIRDGFTMQALALFTREHHLRD